MTVAFLREMGTRVGSVQKLLIQLKKSSVGSDRKGKNANGSSSSSSSSNGENGNSGEVASSIDELTTVLEESESKCQEMVDRLKNAVTDPLANYYWLVILIVYGIMFLMGAEDASSAESGGGGRAGAKKH